MDDRRQCFPFLAKFLDSPHELPESARSLLNSVLPTLEECCRSGSPNLATLVTLLTTEPEQPKKGDQNYEMENDHDIYLSSNESKGYDGYDVLSLPKLTLELERHASEAFFIPGTDYRSSQSTYDCPPGADYRDEEEDRPQSAYTSYVMMQEGGEPQPELVRGESVVIADNPVSEEEREFRKQRLAEGNWNELFMHALEMPDSEEKYQRLSQLGTDFLSVASTFGQIIIDEMYLAHRDKTLRLENVGGTAGGDKFFVRGCLFKYAKDNIIRAAERPTWLYGGDSEETEFAMKAASHELRGAIKYANYGLNVPMQALIDHRGYRLVCMPVLPLSELIYGSDDGGRTVKGSRGPFREAMRRAAEGMHLAEHFVCGKPMFSAGDVEGHAGQDGRSYLLDMARSMPAEDPRVCKHLYPTTVARQAIFFRLLRPEYLQLLKFKHSTGESFGDYKFEPLSADALSKWGATEMAMHNERVTRATTFLIHAVVPSAARDLQTLARTTLKQMKPGELAIELHARGVNMRHAGLLRSHCPETLASDEKTTNGSLVRQLLLIEVVSRTLKQLLRATLREDHKRAAHQPSEFASQNVVVGFLNELTLNPEFWSTPSLAAEVAKRFGPIALQTAKGGAEDLRAVMALQEESGVVLCLVVQYLLSKVGVTIIPSALELFHNDPFGFEFTNTDIVGIGVRVKHMRLVDLSRARCLLTEETTVTPLPYSPDLISSPSLLLERSCSDGSNSGSSNNSNNSGSSSSSSSSSSNSGTSSSSNSNNSNSSNRGSTDFIVTLNGSRISKKGTSKLSNVPSRAVSTRLACRRFELAAQSFDAALSSDPLDSVSRVDALVCTCQVLLLQGKVAEVDNRLLSKAEKSQEAALAGPLLLYLLQIWARQRGDASVCITDIGSLHKPALASSWNVNTLHWCGASSRAALSRALSLKGQPASAPVQAQLEKLEKIVMCHMCGVVRLLASLHSQPGLMNQPPEHWLQSSSPQIQTCFTPQEHEAASELHSLLTKFRVHRSDDYVAELRFRKSLKALCLTGPLPYRNCARACILQAAINGDCGMLNILGEMGLSVDVHGQYDAKRRDADLSWQAKTPLMFAAECGREEACRALLAVNADPNYQAADGGTALHRAAEAGSAKCVQLLLENRATPTIRNAAGHSPLMVAIMRPASVGTQAVLHVLLAECGLQRDDRDSKGFTPLFIAVRENNCAAVETLLERRASHNEKGGSAVYWSTPLFFAATLGHVDVVRCLLRFGAQAVQRSWVAQRHLTPAQAALNFQHTKAAQVIDETVAQRQVIHGSVANIRQNMRKGSLDALNEDGYDLLYCAVASKCVEGVKLLMHMRVMVLWVNTDNAVLRAAKDRNLDLLNILVEYERAHCTKPALTGAVEQDLVDEAQLLLAARAQVNYRSILGSHALLAAVQYNSSAAMLSLLLKSKADVERRDMMGRTPLVWAVKLLSPCLTELLVEAKANVNAKDNGGSSVLTVARDVEAENEEQEKAQELIVQLLQRLGATDSKAQPADTAVTTPADTAATTSADTAVTTPADTAAITPADTDSTTPVRPKTSDTPT